MVERWPNTVGKYKRRGEALALHIHDDVSYALGGLRQVAQLIVQHTPVLHVLNLHFGIDAAEKLDFF